MLIRFLLRFHVSILVFASIAVLVHCTSSESGADSSGSSSAGGDVRSIPRPPVPPISAPDGVKVRYAKDDKPRAADDPESAWEEWGETESSRRNPMPRRQRNIEVGMDINTIMGMAMRQEKVFFAYLVPSASVSQQVGHATISRYTNLMAAGGVGCKLWYVHQNKQVVLKCDTIRDAHMGKDFLLMQPDIDHVVLDNLKFTPKPHPDEEDDDEEEDASTKVGNMETVQKGEERTQEKEKGVQGEDSEGEQNAATDDDVEKQDL